MAFVPGWDGFHAKRAANRLVVTGHYCSVAQPKEPLRRAVSLSRYRQDWYVQGNAGCCWTHAPKELFEVTAAAAGYTPFKACRRLIGFAAKELYEGGGNQSDGGSPTDALNVMTGKGIGVAKESLFPYTDDYNLLAVRPPPPVFEDATRTHLISVVPMRTTREIVVSINAGRPVANGYICSSSTEAEDETFVTEVGEPYGGHSQLIWGYILPGVIDKYLWLEMDNWRGPVYRSLPPGIANLVDGYVPSHGEKTTSKWIREDIYDGLRSLDSYTEHVTATDISGLADGTFTPGPSFLDALPV